MGDIHFLPLNAAEQIIRKSQPCFFPIYITLPKVYGHLSATLKVIAEHFTPEPIHCSLLGALST